MEAPPPGAPGPKPDRQEGNPSPWSILGLFPLVIVSVLVIGESWLRFAEPWLGERLALKASFLPVELGGVLLPPVLLAIAFRTSIIRTFALRPIGGQVILPAALGTIGLSLLLTYVQALYESQTGHRFPPGLKELLTIQNPAEGLLLVTGVVIAPALCEEALFRGYIMQSLSRAPSWLAIGLTALLFSAFHLDLAGLPTYLFLGAWLGWIALRAGSIVPAVVGHALNNAIALLQINLLGEAIWAQGIWVFLPLSVGLFTFGVIRLRAIAERP